MKEIRHALGSTEVCYSRIAEDIAFALRESNNRRDKKFGVISNKH
jgi:hypothetical protein